MVCLFILLCLLVPIETILVGNQCLQICSNMVNSLGILAIDIAEDSVVTYTTDVLNTNFASPQK